MTLNIRVPRTLSIVALLTLPTTLSCHQTPPETDLSKLAANGEGALPIHTLPLLWNRLPLLPPGLAPNGWSDAENAWSLGVGAFEAHRMERASQFFLKAAEALRTAKNARTAESVSVTGRCLAYENAGRALRAARRISQARALLQEAALIDPACKHSVSLRISHMTRATTATVSPRRAGP